jgi:hypothetical protein
MIFFLPKLMYMLPNIGKKLDIQLRETHNIKIKITCQALIQCRFMTTSVVTTIDGSKGNLLDIKKSRKQCHCGSI